MAKLILKICESKSEYQMAFKLASSIFQMPISELENLSCKKILWEEHPSFDYKNIILVIDNKKVVGLVRIVPSVFIWGNKKIKSASLTSICIDEDYRRQGISSRLMKFSIKICKERKYDWCHVFARRSVDHYYLQYGFWGLSSYQKVIFKAGKKIQHDLTIKENSFSTKHIKNYDHFYKYSYRNCLGMTVRDDKQWKLLGQRCTLVKYTFTEIYKGKEIVGYCIYNSESVVEIALHPKTKLNQVVELLSKPLKKVELEVSFDHTLFKDTNALDCTMSSRECSFGGHMIRIINEPKLTFETIKKKLGIYTGIPQVNRKSFNLNYFDQY